MATIHCFKAVGNSTSKTLILGSMPGEASLKAGRYYAHPGNSFWRILCGALDAPADLPYPARLELLKERGIALWDVIDSCSRKGSSDSDIKRTSIRPNDFRAFFKTHPRIERVLFNGAKAEECYTKYVLRELPARYSDVPRRRLPSTSPAHASLSYRRKYGIWKKELCGQIAPARRRGNRQETQLI